MRRQVKKTVRIVRRCILTVILFCVAASILFNVLYRFIYVDGVSMQPTLSDGDWILVSRTAEPERGDIVVTNLKNQQALRLIKRLIAVGGDTVDIDEDGTVFVNGEAIEEPYLSCDMAFAGDVTFPMTVPEGCAFLLGDNRPESLDSRFAEVGCIPLRNIIGPVRVTMPSLNPS